MVFFSPTKNRSHLLSHHIPEVLIHIPCSFRADADAPHAADAFIKDGALRVSCVNGADRAFPGTESASGAVIIACRLQWSATEYLVCFVATFQLQLATEISIKSVLDPACHFKEFGLVFIIGTTCSKLTEDGVFCHSRKCCDTYESLAFKSILKFSQRVFPRTVAIDAVENGLRTVACDLLQPVYCYGRNSSAIRRYGYQAYVALIHVDVINLMTEIDLLIFSLQSFNQDVCYSSCSSSRAEMNTIMSHAFTVLLI